MPIATHVTILPRFFSTYVQHVCPTRPAPRCIELLVAPDVAEQARILQKYDAIKKRHDIRGIEGLVLVKLLHHDTVTPLLHHVDTYNESLEYIRNEYAAVHDGARENDTL